LGRSSQTFASLAVDGETAMAKLAEIEEFYPEIQVTLRDECVTGSRSKIIRTLKMRISAFVRNDEKIRKIYVGIASGAEYSRALWRRYDDFKHGQGINEMIAVYRSSSQENCRQIEKKLEEHYSVFDDERLINRDTGGAGAPSSQRYHYVYIAIQRFG
jgi:hypothetical protein